MRRLAADDVVTVIDDARSDAHLGVDLGIGGNRLGCGRTRIQCDTGGTDNHIAAGDVTGDAGAILATDVNDAAGGAGEVAQRDVGVGGTVIEGCIPRHIHLADSEEVAVVGREIHGATGGDIERVHSNRATVNTARTDIAGVESDSARAVQRIGEGYGGADRADDPVPSRAPPGSGPMVAAGPTPA